MDSKFIHSVSFSPSAIKDKNILMSIIHFIGENKDNLIFFDNSNYDILNYLKQAINRLQGRDRIIAQRVFLLIHRKKYRIITFPEDELNLCSMIQSLVEKGQPSLLILSTNNNLINSASLKIQASCQQTCKLLINYEKDHNKLLLSSEESIINLESLSDIGIDSSWDKTQLEKRIFGPLFKYSTKVTLIDLYLGKNISEGRDDMLQFLKEVYSRNSIFESLKIVIYTLKSDNTFELTDQLISSSYTNFRKGTIEFKLINEQKKNKYHDRHIITDQFTLFLGRSLDILEDNKIILGMGTTISILDEKEPRSFLLEMIQNHRKLL